MATVSLMIMINVQMCRAPLNTMAVLCPTRIRMASMTKKTNVQQFRDWRDTRDAPPLTQIKMVSMMKKTNVQTKLVWLDTRVALFLKPVSYTHLRAHETP